MMMALSDEMWDGSPQMTIDSYGRLTSDIHNPAKSYQHEDNS